MNHEHIQTVALKLIHAIGDKINLSIAEHEKWDKYPEVDRHEFLKKKSNLFYYLQVQEGNIPRLVIQLDFPVNLTTPMMDMETLEKLFDPLTFSMFILTPRSHICIGGYYEEVFFHFIFDGNKYKKDDFDWFKIPYSMGKLPLYKEKP